MSNLAGQRRFHELFGHPVASLPALPEPRIDSGDPGASRAAVMEVELAIRKAIRALGSVPGRRALRVSLLLEEVGELLSAERSDNLTGIADALADIEVIADGTALEYGIPLDAVRAEVDRANLSKLGPDGRPVYREDGKVLKGPDYSPPDVDGVLRACADSPRGNR